MTTTPTFNHGKYRGNISLLQDGWQFTITRDSKQITKHFGISRSHVTPEAREKATMDAYVKAQMYQKEYSDTNGLTKNQWRRVGDVIEVKLQDGLIMTCDPDMLKHVESRIWTARKGKGKKTYYASCRKSKKLKYEACQFHNLICPEFKQVDHIDRNGLNNCRSNLRDGSGRVNALNKSKQKNNTSGHTGIRYEPPKGNKKGRWRAQYVDEHGKRRCPSFTLRVDTEEEKELQKQRAIAFREEKMRITRKSLGM